MSNKPKFAQTYCSQCGCELGPGDAGVSHCEDHLRALSARLAGLQSTHSPECFEWHHACAVAEVKRLRAAIAKREALGGNQ